MYGIGVINQLTYHLALNEACFDRRQHLGGVVFLLSLFLGITLRDRKRSTWIKEKTKLKELQIVKQQKWRWAGHSARRHDNRWTKRPTGAYGTVSTVEKDPTLDGEMR